MFDDYTEIHWYEIFYLERRLVEDTSQLCRVAHTKSSWAAIKDLVRDGVFEQVNEDPVAPLFALTDLGWEIAGKLRRHLAEHKSFTVREFVITQEGIPNGLMQLERVLVRIENITTTEVTVTVLPWDPKIKVGVPRSLFPDEVVGTLRVGGHVLADVNIDAKVVNDLVFTNIDVAPEPEDLNF